MNVKWRRQERKPLSARGLRLYALKKKRKCAADSFAQTVWPGKVHSPASDHSRIESLHELREMRHRKRLRSEEHTSELQSRLHLVCRLLLEKKTTTDYLRVD